MRPRFSGNQSNMPNFIARLRRANKEISSKMPPKPQFFRAPAARSETILPRKIPKNPSIFRAPAGRSETILPWKCSKTLKIFAPAAHKGNVIVWSYSAPQARKNRVFWIPIQGNCSVWVSKYKFPGRRRRPAPKTVQNEPKSQISGKSEIS